MIFRITWLCVKPMSQQGFQKLTKAIAADQFTPDLTSGFIVDSERNSVTEARFIQRRTYNETFTDPFGNESKVERTDYTQTRFTLFNTLPHLEITNPPRNLAPFINRLGELCEGKTAIYPPEETVAERMRTIAKFATSAKIIGLLISNLQLGPTTTAKVLVKGNEDVKKLLPSFIGPRKHVTKEAQLEVMIGKDCLAQITIKENCRFTVQTQDAGKSLRFLRQMIRSLGDKYITK